jgi:xanthine dehydrogenase accessory factor
VNGTVDDLRARAVQLRADRRGFVTATVVRAEKPTSAQAGDSALVLDDGTVLGFIGGECARASVQAQALLALDQGRPVLLRITPSAASEAPPTVESGAVTVHNPCLSGGTLEIFLEPTVPPAMVVVHGDAPIAVAVRELAGWLGFATDTEASGDPDAVVVATHGGDEGPVIQAALVAGVGYVALVASRRRGSAVLDGLDLAPEDRARVHTPAGLDIGARTPPEVALSILAEIVSLRPRRPVPAAATPPAGAPTAVDPMPHMGSTAVDPVCGMTVAAVETTRHVDVDGVRHWFCGPGCEEAFLAARR